MDMWSDPNLRPFMAITAHWIESTPQQTTAGVQHKLMLHTNLIGFHSVPGWHTGEHMCHVFVHVLDRLGITAQVRGRFAEQLSKAYLSL